jgi:hypothetical protein
LYGKLDITKMGCSTVLYSTVRSADYAARGIMVGKFCLCYLFLSVGPVVRLTSNVPES